MKPKNNSNQDYYRETLLMLSQQCEENPRKIYIDQINAIAKAATTDKQLEDLQLLHEKIAELEKAFADLTKAGADVRHNRSSRIEANDA